LLYSIPLLAYNYSHIDSSLPVCSSGYIEASLYAYSTSYIDASLCAYNTGHIDSTILACNTGCVDVLEWIYSTRQKGILKYVKNMVDITVFEIDSYMKSEDTMYKDGICEHQWLNVMQTGE
jgi:hypothetical protein